MQVMFCGIAKVVIVFMATFTSLPDMAAIYTRKAIRMRSPTTSHFYVYPLARLQRIPVARREWARAT